MRLSEPPRVARREPRRAPPGPPGRVPVHPLLLGLTGVIVLIQVLQALAPAGLVPQFFGWPAMFTLLGFWDTDFELAMAGENFPLRLFWSPLTHAFLHAGWLHLVLNMAAFLGLGHAISQAIGAGRLLLAFLVCAVAGALTFGLIGDIQGPLVGASGAVFGFLAIITAWQERALAHRGLSRRPIWGRLLGLAAINAVLDLGLGGLVAWEAHLGGFVAGWLLALLWPPARSVRLPF